MSTLPNLTYYLYRLGGTIAPKLPPAKGYAVCRVLSKLLYQLNRRAAANVRFNLGRVLGNQPSATKLNKYAQLTFEHILFNYFDLLRLASLDLKTINNLVSVHGWEHVERALAGGNGMILASAHVGNIEMMLHAILLRGVKIIIPAERIEPPRLFEYVTALRAQKGLRFIPVDRPLLQLIRTLRQGGVVGLAGDRDITGSGQVCSFFNHPAYLPTGHARLAVKTGAPIVMGFSYRNIDHTFKIIFSAPFHPPKSGTNSERLAACMQFVVRHLENAIRQAPEQWSLTVSIWADA